MKKTKIYDKYGNEIGEAIDVDEMPGADLADAIGCMGFLVIASSVLFSCAAWWVAIKELTAGNMRWAFIVPMVLTVFLHASWFLKNGWKNFLGMWIAMVLTSTTVSCFFGIVLDGATENVDTSIFVVALLMSAIPALIAAWVVKNKTKT